MCAYQTEVVPPYLIYTLKFVGKQAPRNPLS